MNTQIEKKPRMVLIDDDQSYGVIMLRAAKAAGVKLDFYTSLLEVGSVGLLGRYDVVFVDYDLGELNGVEIAEYLSALFDDIPMILISQTPRLQEGATWPDSIVSFIPKSAGYRYVIDRAYQLHKNRQGQRPNLLEQAV